MEVAPILLRYALQRLYSRHVTSYSQIERGFIKAMRKICFS